MSNGNAHDRNNPPAVLVGGANGRLKGNRHIAVEKKEPTANLLLAIADLANARGRDDRREHRPAADLALAYSALAGSGAERRRSCFGGTSAPGA